MPILTQPAFGPKVALAYVTAGMLIDVWTLVWYFTRDYDLSRSQQFWVIGLVLTGLTFIILGLLLGPLGRQAAPSRTSPAGRDPRGGRHPAHRGRESSPWLRTQSPLPVAPVMPAAPVMQAAPQAPPGTVIVNPHVRTT